MRLKILGSDGVRRFGGHGVPTLHKITELSNAKNL
jgi:hypothetical protein